MSAMRVSGGRVGAWVLGCCLGALSACGGRTGIDAFSVTDGGTQPGSFAGQGDEPHGGGASGGGASNAGEANDLTTGWPEPPLDPGSEATTFQINARHDGAQLGDTLSLPLHRRWSRRFGSDAFFATISYPLVAAGRVFVTIARGSSSELVALDEASGATLWGPIELGGLYASFAAYALGRVFAVNSNGVLQAFDAASGKQIWKTQLSGQYSFASPPVVQGRTVFVARGVSGGVLDAVAGNTGRVIWTARVQNGDSSSPVVTDSGAFLSYACLQAYGFELAAGAQLWYHNGHCDGESALTIALLGGALFARGALQSSQVLDVRSGLVRGTFLSDTIPAGNAATAFTTQQGHLVATPLSGSAQPIWIYSATTVTSAPLAVGSTVVVGTTTIGGADSHAEIDVLDATNGAVLASDSLPAPISAPDELIASPLTGMAAADNHLFFSAGDVLYGY